MNGRITISPPSDESLEQIHGLMVRAINHAARGDGFDPETTDWLPEQLARAKRLVVESMSPGDRTRFLIAHRDGVPIATIARTPASDLIREALPGIASSTQEIVCVLVDPSYHGQGIGRALHKAMTTLLSEEGHEGYVLDCGYLSSQGFWKRVLGAPDVVMSAYWGEGYDHLVWERKL